MANVEGAFLTLNVENIFFFLCVESIFAALNDTSMDTLVLTENIGSPLAVKSRYGMWCNAYHMILIIFKTSVRPIRTISI